MSHDPDRDVVELGIIRETIADMRRWLIRAAMIGTLTPADRVVIEAFIADYAQEAGLS